MNVTNDDFPKVINELRKTGMTDGTIARICGCSRQYIYKIRKERAGRVGYSIGAKLKALYEAAEPWNL